MSEIKFFDTNALLYGSNGLSELDEFYISSITIKELENIKTSSSKDDNIKYLAREVLRFLDKNSNYKMILIKEKHRHTLREFNLNDTPDNLICACAYDVSQSKEILFISNDLICNHVADKVFGLKTAKNSFSNDTDYTGVVEISGSTRFVNVTIAEMEDGVNRHNLIQNQYIIIHNTDLDENMEYRYDNGLFKKIKLPPYKVIKALNSHQKCALDLLYNTNIPIKVIAGTYGSGKTMLATKVGLHYIFDKGHYNKFLMVRNPCPAEGIQIGYLPGTKQEKVGDFYKTILQYVEDDKQFKNIQDNPQVQMEVVSFMKGINVEDTYMIIDEAEDLNVKLIKMLGTRIDSKSCVVFCGDWKQAESKYKYNNGLAYLIDKAKGNPLFGCVVLKEDVRSEASKLFADLLD